MPVQRIIGGDGFSGGRSNLVLGRMWFQALVVLNFNAVPTAQHSLQPNLPVVWFRWREKGKHRYAFTISNPPCWQHHRVHPSAAWPLDTLGPARAGSVTHTKVMSPYPP